MTDSMSSRIWSLVDGVWYVIDRTRPGKTFNDLFMEQPARLAVARQYNPQAQIIVVIGDYDPNEYHDWPTAHHGITPVV
jgi:hypothetical protein